MQQQLPIEAPAVRRRKKNPQLDSEGYEPLVAFCCRWVAAGWNMPHDDELAEMMTHARLLGDVRVSVAQAATARRRAGYDVRQGRRRFEEVLAIELACGRDHMGAGGGELHRLRQQVAQLLEDRARAYRLLNKIAAASVEEAQRLAAPQN
ncbi:MAG: hypothetical protein ACXWVD_00495 [Telluria sp.]